VGSGRPLADLTILDGSTFFVSAVTGDVEAVRAEGFFHADVRHLSRWQLRIGEEPLSTLSSRTVDYYSARIVAAARADSGTDTPMIALRRERFIAGGVHEDLILENLTDDRCELELVLEFASDFGDIFECRTRPRKHGVTSAEVGEREVALRYERGDYIRMTLLRFGQPCALTEDRATFSVKLRPREIWKTCVDIIPVVEGDERPSRRRCGEFGRPEPDIPVSLDEWLDSAPRLETDWEGLRQTYRQSLIDLAALRFRTHEDPLASLPAGGLPWFMALFGRDSIITAYQALPFQPDLARATLETLARYQATERDDFRDSEPGKILHELRRGELAVLGDVPHSPYFGTHDATPLFLVLLDEYALWTGDHELVRSLEPAARAAVRWITEEGDLDDDGFLEYLKRSPRGLDNQAWKDSRDAILFADARRANPPIAMCEVQGYAYDALRRTARLARDVWGDWPFGDRLDDAAETLRLSFDDAFWHEERGHYAFALDRDKVQVDALTSNTGHLLWSGLANPERANATVERLVSAELFSGWGVRTMSSRNAGYNPLAYHNGSVWPHDSALVAEGMRRYGYREQASRTAVALLEAAEAFEGRLPELFAGFDRSETGFPVEYESASRPQAFAAGAPLLALRTLLGLDVRDGEVVRDPWLPDGIAPIALDLQREMPRRSIDP
jgi:glycogen debranching enzyme